MASGFETNIIDIANDFYEAYKRCCEGKDSQTDEYGRTISHYVGIPAIVNGAFACELYLKSIIHKKYWKTDKHNLKKLLSRLPIEKQTQIYNSITSILDLQNYSYDDYLNALSNCFDFWRYIHEKENFGKLGFNETIKALSVFLGLFRELSFKEDK